MARRSARVALRALDPFDPVLETEDRRAAIARCAARSSDVSWTAGVDSRRAITPAPNAPSAAFSFSTPTTRARAATSPTSPPWSASAGPESEQPAAFTPPAQFASDAEIRSRGLLPEQPGGRAQVATCTPRSATTCAPSAPTPNMPARRRTWPVCVDSWPAEVDVLIESRPPLLSRRGSALGPRSVATGAADRPEQRARQGLHLACRATDREPGETCAPSRTYRPGRTEGSA